MPAAVPLGTLLSRRGVRPLLGATLGATLANWVQNVVLAAHISDVTGSATLVGLIVLAQLGPLLVMGPVAGAITDAVNRRTLLRVAATIQATCGVIVGWVSFQDSRATALLVLPVIGCGIGQALFLPAYTSLLPGLVAPDELRRLVALNSTLLSLARVLGPAMGALLYALAGAGLPLALVAAGYAAVALLARWIPPPRARVRAEHRFSLRGLAAGVVTARHDPVIRRILVTIAVFSVFCLPFLNQMPIVAARNFGINPHEETYTLVFAAFGVGSLIGGAAIATVLATHDADRLSRQLLWIFAALMAGLALVRSAGLAIPVLALLGVAYFGIITVLLTRLQIHLTDGVRGRVMSLWFMGFGGMLPVGAALAGPIIEVTSVTAMLLVSSAAALGLSWYVGRPATPAPATA